MQKMAFYKLSHISTIAVERGGEGSSCDRLCACDVRNCSVSFYFLLYQNKIPSAFELDKIHRNFGTDISPTTVVLLQELERWNKLIYRMAKSLVELQKVCCLLCKRINFCLFKDFHRKIITNNTVFVSVIIMPLSAPKTAD